MIRRSFLLLALGLLAGCASISTTPPGDRDGVRYFSLDARFALRATLPDQAPHSANGRLSWTHHAGGDRILVANPLGYGLAEIDMTADRSTLRTGDGKEWTSANPDALLEDATGLPLPVLRLPAWLLGRNGPDATLQTDAVGRPGRLLEAGWQVSYSYDDDRPTALPARLTILRPGEIELKLRIEEWREMP